MFIASWSRHINIHYSCIDTQGVIGNTRQNITPRLAVKGCLGTVEFHIYIFAGQLLSIGDLI